MSENLFRIAQKNLAQLADMKGEEQMLDALREVFCEHGEISGERLNRDFRTLGRGAYAARFGSLAAAYELAGIPLSRQQRAAIQRAKDRGPYLPTASGPDVPLDLLVERLKALAAKHDRLTVRIMSHADNLPTLKILTRRFGSISGIYEAIGYQPSPLQVRSMKPKTMRRPLR